MVLTTFPQFVVLISPVSNNRRINKRFSSVLRHVNVDQGLQYNASLLLEESMSVHGGRFFSIVDFYLTDFWEVRAFSRFVL